MDSPMRIIIVGGGTAGWMAANLFAKRWAHLPIQITVVESPDIKTVGVGEGSTPTLQQFFKQLNILDEDWMPHCNATYKYNIKFSGWSPGSGIDSYNHPFFTQLDTFTERPFTVNCYTRRLGLDVITQPDTFFFNSYLTEHHKLPYTPDNFPFEINYGYHFDSQKLGQFLMGHAKKLAVEHKLLTVDTVTLADNGDIKELHGSKGEVVKGEFFVDCTGFRSQLLQQTLGVTFNSFNDNLFNDAAIVLPTQVHNAKFETQSIAMSNGWRWQIPLTHRQGNGYVYSKDFQSPDKAEQELRQSLGLLDSDVEAMHLNMKVGQVNKHWHKNCLALGLSQGFIEPLEATALHLVQISIESFMDRFQNGNYQETDRDEFNQLTKARFDSVRDYIVAHYKLNTRNDSDYWRANRDNNNLSDSLLQLLDTWFTNGDVAQEIKTQNAHSHFGNASWHCLLAGYGTFPQLAANQPGTGDQFHEHQLHRFLHGCLLNFNAAK
jgi:hypothetical protein